MTDTQQHSELETLRAEVARLNQESADINRDNKTLFDWLEETKEREKDLRAESECQSKAYGMLLTESNFFRKSNEILETENEQLHKHVAKLQEEALYTCHEIESLRIGIERLREQHDCTIDVLNQTRNENQQLRAQLAAAAGLFERVSAMLDCLGGGSGGCIAEIDAWLESIKPLGEQQ